MKKTITLLICGVVAVACLSAITIYLKNNFSEDLRSTKVQTTDEGQKKKKKKTTKKSKIDKYKEEIAEILQKKPENIQPIASPVLEKQVYEFEIEGQKFILKENSKRSKMEKKKATIELAQLISDNKLGPKFIGSSTDNDIYIMSFDGNALTTEAIKDDKTLKEIGGKLKKAHELTGDFSNTQSEYQVAKRHFRNIMKKRNSIPSNLDAAFGKYEEESKAIKVDKKFCHSNLSADNIMKLDNGNIIFTGWSKAGKGDQFEDLGHFVASCMLNDEQIRVFMIGYLDGAEPDKDTLKKLKSYTNRAVFSLVLSLLDDKYEDVQKYKKENLEKVLAEPTIENLATCLKAPEQ